MITVWKYVWPMSPPTDVATFDMPSGADVLCAREQADQVCIWAKVDSGAPKTTRRFVLCGTGHKAPDGKYIGTASLYGGSLILHVFEVFG